MLDVKQLEVEYVTDENGQTTAVIIPFDQFQELIEEIEDLAAVADRREEPTVAHSDLVSELKRDGLL